MAHHALEQEVADLNRRVTRLERMVKGPRSFWKFPAVPRPEEMERVFGWFLLTVCALALAGQWLTGGGVPPSLAILTLLALWLTLRHSSLIGMSDSTIQLEQQGRSQRRLRGSALHEGPSVPKLVLSERVHNLRILQTLLLLLGTAVLTLSLTWLLLSQVGDPSVQLLVLVVMAGLALAYAVRFQRWNLFALALIALYVLVALSQAPVLSVAVACLAAVAMAWLAYSRQNWPLMLLTVLLSYAVLGRWSALLQPAGMLAYSEVDIYRLGMMLAAVLCICLVAFAAPFVLRRRAADERAGVRAILLANAAGYTVASLWLLDASLRGGWYATHSITLLVSSVMGYLAWHRHGRASYAKYFFLISLVAAFALVSGQPEQTLAATFWFIMAVILFGAGFLISSYTVRVAGGVILALVASYFALVLVPRPAAGLLWVSDRLWLGVLLAAFLFLLAQWYRTAVIKGGESRFRSELVQISTMAGVLAVAGLDGLGTTGGDWQSLLWIAAAAIAWFVGRRHGYASLRALGLALAAAALVRIALVDSLLLEPSGRLVLLAILGIGLLSVGYLTVRYPNRALAYL